MTLQHIHGSVQRRADEIASRREWPCRKGCDECCRRLAAIPRVSDVEWQLIAEAISELPPDTAALVRSRIQRAATASRPVVCPLLEEASGTCLVYHARPVACRAYGFYAEREYVLGCARIESVSAQSPDVIWGNHEALEDELRSLGPALELWQWPKPKLEASS